MVVMERMVVVRTRVRQLISIRKSQKKVNLRSKSLEMRIVLGVTSADNGQIEKNSTPLKNTS